jgi:hypothetical protein
MKPAKSEDDKDMVFNPKTLRLLVGLIAFWLPWVVIFFASQVTSSISASYHTNVRDLFVGALFVIGALFVAYNGHQVVLDEKNVGRFWQWLGGFWKDAVQFRIRERTYEERVVSLVGGLAAILAALFPTACDECTIDLKSRVHGIAAVILFAGVVYFCLVGFLDQVKDALRQTWQKGGRAKLRAWIYLVCGVSIIVIMVAALAAPHALTAEIARGRSIMFWAETAALALFGFAWMTASKFLRFLVDEEEEQLKLIDIKRKPKAARQEVSTGA